MVPPNPGAVLRVPGILQERLHEAQLHTRSAQYRQAAAHAAVAIWAGAGTPGVSSWGRTRHSITPTTPHGPHESMK